MLMFDLTRRATFEALDGWLSEVGGKAPEDTPVVLVGNKLDLGARAVSHAEAEAWAAKHGLAYVETSAADDVGINEAFVTVVARAVGRGDELARVLTSAKVLQGGLGTPRDGLDAADRVEPANGPVRLSHGRSVRHESAGGGCAC
jgi:hypothetical protein